MAAPGHGARGRQALVRQDSRSTRSAGLDGPPGGPCLACGQDRAPPTAAAKRPTPMRGVRCGLATARDARLLGDPSQRDDPALDPTALGQQNRGAPSSPTPSSPSLRACDRAAPRIACSRFARRSESPASRTRDFCASSFATLSMETNDAPALPPRATAAATCPMSRPGRLPRRSSPVGDRTATAAPRASAPAVRPPAARARRRSAFVGERWWARHFVGKVRRACRAGRSGSGAGCLGEPVTRFRADGCPGRLLPARRRGSPRGRGRGRRV
jgi:hypothetical protein